MFSSRFKDLLAFPSSKRFEGNAPSHDTTFAGYHVTQPSFLRQLDLAVRGAWPTRHQSKYLDVMVLLMSWESDDLGVEKEVQELKSVFSTLYRFDVKVLRIPDKDPAIWATKKVIHYLQSANHPDKLIILYYAGLTESSPDVLLLYDCCHPANGHGTIESGRAVVELLAACGFESIANEVGASSFSHSLARELAKASESGRPISVPELHRRQLSRHQNLEADPKFVRGNSGESEICRDRDGYLVYEEPVCRTPIHCQLSQNQPPRAIVLSPLPETSSSNQPFIQLNTDCNTDSKEALVHALLRVSLVEDAFDETAFKDWLCSAPEGARKIGVIGALASFSTMLLIQVPVEVWDLLPASPAIAFLGYVREEATPNKNVSSCEAQSEGSRTNPRQKQHSDGEEAKILPTDGQIIGGKEEEQDSSRRVASSKGKGKSVSFDFQNDNEKLLASLLDDVDKALPRIFQRVRLKALATGTRRSDWILQEVLQELDISSELQSTETRSFVERYVSARDLMEVDNPVLDISRRFNPLAVWRDFDAVNYATSDISDSRQSAQSHSIFSETPTLDTTATQDQEDNIELAPTSVDHTSLISEFPLDALAEEFHCGPRSHNSHTNNSQPQHNQDDYPSGHAPIEFLLDSYSSLQGTYERRHKKIRESKSRHDTSSRGDSFFSPIDQTRSNQDHDPSHKQDYRSFSEEGQSPNEEDGYIPGEPSASTVEENPYYGTEQPANLQNVEKGAIWDVLDTSKIRGREFRQIFKVLWSEPTKSKVTETLSDTETRESNGAKFYVGVGRFIVIANDEGNCTCVPIVTYQRRGCKKRGVKASKHGIIYDKAGKPVTLPGEPPLGFDPIRAKLYHPDEKLAEESRVNYAKLVTVEHNVRVQFIGRVVRHDFDGVQRAVEDCWAAKLHRAGESGGRKKTDTTRRRPGF
ncbi:hypothetical protein OQA88_12692 [Cercophora sp. LCS_1]